MPGGGTQGQALGGLGGVAGAGGGGNGGGGGGGGPREAAGGGQGSVAGMYMQQQQQQQQVAQGGGGRPLPDGMSYPTGDILSIGGIKGNLNCTTMGGYIYCATFFCRVWNKFNMWLIYPPRMICVCMHISVSFLQSGAGLWPLFLSFYLFLYFFLFCQACSCFFFYIMPVVLFFAVVWDSRTFYPFGGHASEKSG